MLTNAFAYRVRHDPEGRVLVSYWHGGRVATVRARAAIINAEANIATRILEDIPAELKSAMEAMRRFSYPTFHFCSREPIYQRGYRVGVMDSTIQAVTVPDWFSRDRGPGRPNILSCFNKMSLEDVEMVNDRKEMVKMSCQVLSELDLRFPGTIEKVEAVHVFLRNRNYCTPYPGYITEVFPKLGKPYGSIFFANAEYLNPVTHFPEAVEAGTQAAPAGEEELLLGRSALRSTKLRVIARGWTAAGEAHRDQAANGRSNERDLVASGPIEDDPRTGNADQNAEGVGQPHDAADPGEVELAEAAADQHRRDDGVGPEPDPVGNRVQQQQIDLAKAEPDDEQLQGSGSDGHQQAGQRQDQLRPHAVRQPSAEQVAEDGEAIVSP